jgi:hypothetical protein
MSGKAIWIQVEVSIQKSQTPPPSTQNGLAKWIVKIHGQETIRYPGLLAMAHEQGLIELKAEFISVSETLALAAAYAVFKDGRKFWDAADATPNNVRADLVREE